MKLILRALISAKLNSSQLSEEMHIIHHFTQESPCFIINLPRHRNLSLQSVCMMLGPVFTSLIPWCTNHGAPRTISTSFTMAREDMGLKEIIII